MEQARTSDAAGRLVLLHAAGSGPRALAALAGHLAPEAADVVAPVLPLAVDPVAAGHPAPAVDAAAFDHATARARAPGSPFARQIAIARAAVGAPGAAGPVILLGHSFGGLVALLALLEGARPDAAVLYEPVAFGVLDPTCAGDGAARAWDRALVDHLAERVTAGNAEAGVARFIEGWNEVAWPTLPEGVRRAMVADAPRLVALTGAVHHLPLDRAAVGRIDVPVLLMTGDRSPDVARRIAERLANALPRATLRRIADAGHMAPVLAAERVAGAVRAWLADRGPAGAGLRRS